MNYKKTKFALALAGMIFSGSFLTSAAESAPDLEILSIDVMPQSEGSGSSGTEAPQGQTERETTTRKSRTSSAPKKKTESEAEAAEKKAESEAEAEKKAESEAAQKKAESEAEAKRKAESEAAQKKAESEAEAAVNRAESEAEARKKAESEAEAAVKKAESEAEARKRAESEAKAALKKAEAAAEKAESEAEARKKAESEAAAAVERAEARDSAEESETEISSELTAAETGTGGSADETETEIETGTEAWSETEASSVPVPQGLYEIAPALDSGLVIDIRHCTVDETVSRIPQLYHSLDVNQQKFYLEALPEGCYRLSALDAGEILTVSESGGEASSVMTMDPGDPGASDTSSWIFEQADGDFFYIHTRDGQYLTLDEAEVCEGGSVALSGFSRTRAQMWELCPARISSGDTADTDLVNPYQKGGRYSNLKFAMRFGSRTETLTASDLAPHMTETEDHQLILDPEFLDSYVSSLAEKYNTRGQSVKFRTTCGADVIVYEAEHAWKLDTEGMKTLLEESLEWNQFRSLSPVWEQSGDTDYERNGVGDSYVEVDLTNQKVYLYKDGKQMIASDCVSGAAGDPERETPDGVYYIYMMRSPATLNGPDYSEFVNFWMPFYQGYGLHDATWREEFGGDIYLTDGSHGCINMPYETAELIYNTVEVGYPVVLYR